MPTESGPIRTQQHLAYWCIWANYYLGLDRGDKHIIEWEPYEDLFQQPNRLLSKATKPLELDRNEDGRPMGAKKYTAEIDAFFDALETANREQQ